MKQTGSDSGVITVLLERLEKQRLPRLLALKKKVDSGESLNNLELEFMGNALKDASKVIPLIEKHPEYQPLATKVVGLYKEITQKALDIEKGA